MSAPGCIRYRGLALTRRGQRYASLMHLTIDELVVYALLLVRLGRLAPSPLNTSPEALRAAIVDAEQGPVLVSLAGGKAA